VIDIGAQNVNGSLKDVCPKPLEIRGRGLRRAPGVDVVLKDPYTLPFKQASIDVAVSNSCFEHSEMFWLLFLEILRVLKPDGLFYLNAPSNGKFHRFPVDCWRFLSRQRRRAGEMGRAQRLRPDAARILRRPAGPGQLERFRRRLRARPASCRPVPAPDSRYLRRSSPTAHAPEPRTSSIRPS